MNKLIERIGNVDFEITSSCNLICLHCYNKPSKISEELETREVLELINQITNLGFKEIHINGGEPLEHPDVMIILDYCNNNKLETLLETNGTLLNNPNMKEIANLSYVKIRASIDGPEEIHNSIRRCRKGKEIENSYLTSLKNLVYAQSLGIPVQITCSVNNLNYNHLIEMAEDIENKGIEDLRLRLSMPSGRGYIHWQILKLDSKKFEEVKRQISYIDKNFSFKFDGKSILRINPKLEQKMFITPNGDVKPYPFIEVYVGNVRNNSLNEILNHYGNVIFPDETEKLIDNYLFELGMSDNNE
jgi:MoaA/NifB/PqqE/SkfB family radical SAM enzyme